MKAVLSGAVVLLMTVALYGEGKHLYIHRASTIDTIFVKSVDSLTFGTGWIPGDSITDTRDGQKYATVQIGTQIWMAENLNIGTRKNGSVTQTNNGIIEKYAYNDDESNATVNGGLYQWNEAMNYSTTEGAQGICPNGWHIPTDEEWDTLVNAVGGSLTGGAALKAGGSSGFQALFSGSSLGFGSFYDMGYSTTFWCSSQDDPERPWFWFIYADDAEVVQSIAVKTNGYCIRCIRD